MSTLSPSPPPHPPEPPVGELIPREAGTDVPRDVANVRKLAHLLDSAVGIPGTKFRIGLDALIGMIPVVGDLSGMLAGGYILTTAARLGVPKAVLARMLLNIGADAAIGSVPLVGDVFDVTWKANTRNAALLESAVGDSKAVGRSSAWVLAGVLGGLLAITIGGIVLTIVLIRMLWTSGG